LTFLRQKNPDYDLVGGGEWNFLEESLGGGEVFLFGEDMNDTRYDAKG